jgi:peptidoglycan/LPS O-acetylase OafA/YrhL
MSGGGASAAAEGSGVGEPRFRELDGIRGIAILMVVICHYFTTRIESPVPGSWLAYFHLATGSFWSGVDLFFVLSGFLIGGIILDHHGKRGFLKVFWIRRSCRILPVLALLLGVCGVAWHVLDRSRYAWLFDDLMPFWSYATFTQNIFMGMRGTFGGNFLGVTWSLAVEEQFYLLAPLLIVWVGRRRWVRGLIPLIVVAFFLRVAFGGGTIGYVNTFFRMDSLLTGVLVAVLFRSADSWRHLEKGRGSLALAFFVMLASTGVLTKINGFGYFKFSWFALLYGAFLALALLYRGTAWTAALRAPWLCFFGGIAYGLYMYHQAVQGLLHGWLRDGAKPGLQDAAAVQVTWLSLGVATLAAAVSFRFYEAFFLRIGKRYRYGA